MAAKKLIITLSTGKTIEVQPTLEDRLRFESTLRKNRGWGDLKDNALKLSPFLAWSAASRSGAIDLTWDQFTSGSSAAIDVEEADDKEAEEADGTDADTEVEGLGKGTAKKSSRTTT